TIIKVEPAVCPRSSPIARVSPVQTPGEQFRQRGRGEIGLMPILETSRDVTDPRCEDCRQTVAIVLGVFFPEPDVEVCQLGCGSALPQSGGTLRIDAGPQQAIADDGPNGVPGAWRAVSEARGGSGARPLYGEPSQAAVTRARHRLPPTPAAASRSRWS